MAAIRALPIDSVADRVIDHSATPATARYQASWLDDSTSGPYAAPTSTNSATTPAPVRPRPRTLSNQLPATSAASPSTAIAAEYAIGSHWPDSTGDFSRG